MNIKIKYILIAGSIVLALMLECTHRSGQRVQEISTLPEGVREEDSSWQPEEGSATCSSAW